MINFNCEENMKNRIKRIKFKIRYSFMTIYRGVKKVLAILYYQHLYLLGRKYTYQVEGFRLGGEHTIGTIPRKVADYWIDKGEDAFEEYMMSCDHYEMEDNIPKEYHLPEWWEVDEIMHQSTVEFEVGNEFIVTNKDTGEEITIPMTDDLIFETNCPETDYYEKMGDELKDPLVFGQAFAKGTFHFSELELDKPFDRSKFNVGIEMWSNLKLVEKIWYGNRKWYFNEDGITLLPEGEDSWSKSDCCWIDD